MSSRAKERNVSDTLDARRAPFVKPKKKGRKDPGSPPEGTDAVAEAAPRRRHEVLALLAFAATVLLLLSLTTFDERDIIPGVGPAHNLIGPVGAYLAYGLYTAFGYASYVVTVGLALGGVVALTRKPVIGWLRGAGLFLILPTVALLFHLALRHDADDFAGGFLGAFLGEGLRQLFHDTGAWLVAVSLAVLALLMTTSLSLLAVGRLCRRWGTEIGRAAQVRFARWQRRRARAQPEPVPPIAAEDDPDEAEVAALQENVDRALRRSRRKTKDVAEAPVSADAAGAAEVPVPIPEEEAEEASPAAPPPPNASPPPKATSPAPKIVESRRRQKPIEEETTEMLQGEFHFAQEARDWTLPPLTLLEYDESTNVSFDRDDLMRSSERLTRALADFKVEGRVVEIHPGPVITMFEFEPAAGTKVRQIQGLEDDLALALQALKVRIAPIPGKGVLGIEVANREREVVYLKEIIAADRFRKAKTKLPLALGKDISGHPVVSDLAKMPHLLVAGTTGSGKSVGLNTMLISLLYTATPEEVRIILVDQKTTEFGPYDGVPHLLLPVVVDPKRAAVALRWAVEEMERRYAMMSELGVRHISSYNKKIDQLDAKGEPLFDETEEGEDGEPKKLTKMPYILVMIDELADLMMVAPREVEASLQRLAQMARAAGIHIVIATQRPSVDVVSGVIRSNFPARIAYQTRTRTDSRTILDDGGAEQLLGQGDMLLLPPGTSTLSRVHGAFVSDAEVKSITDFWREQGKPDYDPTILESKEEDSGVPEEDFHDEMYDHAVALVAETRQVSISGIQRRLRVGYNRAARMVERMEREGIIGPADGTKPREVYVQHIDNDGIHP